MRADYAPLDLPSDPLPPDTGGEGMCGGADGGAGEGLRRCRGWGAPAAEPPARWHHGRGGGAAAKGLGAGGAGGFGGAAMAGFGAGAGAGFGGMAGLAMAGLGAGFIAAGAGAMGLGAGLGSGLWRRHSRWLLGGLCDRRRLLGWRARRRLGSSLGLALRRRLACRRCAPGRGGRLPCGGLACGGLACGGFTRTDVYARTLWLPSAYGMPLRAWFFRAFWTSSLSP